MPKDTSQQVRLKNANTAGLVFLQSFPEIPQDVKARFPSMVQYEKKLKDWVRQATFQIQGTGGP